MLSVKKFANHLISNYADDDGSGPGSAQRQADALQQENVEVTTDSMGEWYVDFSRYGWFPTSLPNDDVAGDNL